MADRILTEATLPARATAPGVLRRVGHAAPGTRARRAWQAPARTQAAGTSWVLMVHTDMAPLEPDWRRLETQGCATLFQTYDWLRVWYDAVCRHGLAETVIVTGRRSGAERIEVILPLCRLRRYGASVLSFPDILVSDFAGPVFAPEAFEEAGSLADFWAALRAALPHDDAIHLTKITEMIGTARNPLLALPRLWRMPDYLWGLPLVPGAARPCPSIPADVLSSTDKRRAQLARKTARTVTWTPAGGECAEQFEELVRMRLARCERIGREEILTEPVWADFYRGLVRERHAGIEVVITRLRAGEETIAIMMGVGCKGAFHYLLPTFAMQKWSRYTPGFQLLVEAIEAAAARGYHYFDLTIGNEPYKKKFGAEQRPLYESFTALTWKGHAMRVAWLLKTRLRRVRSAIRRWLDAA